MPPFVSGWYLTPVPLVVTEDGTIHAFWTELPDDGTGDPRIVGCKNVAGQKQWASTISLVDAQNRDVHGWPESAVATPDSVVHLLWGAEDGMWHGQVSQDNRLASELVLAEARPAQAEGRLAVTPAGQLHVVYLKVGKGPTELSPPTDDSRLFGNDNRLFDKQWSPAQSEWAEARPVSETGAWSFALGTAGKRDPLLVVGYPQKLQLMTLDGREWKEVSNLLLGEEFRLSPPGIESFSVAPSGNALVLWSAGGEGGPLWYSVFRDGEFAQPTVLTKSMGKPCLSACDKNGMYHVLANTTGEASGDNGVEYFLADESGKLRPALAPQVVRGLSLAADGAANVHVLGLKWAAPTLQGDTGLYYVSGKIADLPR